MEQDDFRLLRVTPPVVEKGYGLETLPSSGRVNAAGLSAVAARLRAKEWARARGRIKRAVWELDLKERAKERRRKERARIF